MGTFAHEYGHVMDLDELFDRDGKSESNQDHSAGIGRWGVMGRGAPGWVIKSGTEDGPNPMTLYSRMKAGWLAAANRLENVTEDRMDVSIHDINSSKGKAYKIPVPGSSSEYFLLANRQNTHSDPGDTPGSYYDDRAKASGLAIWHVDENAQRGRLDAVKYEQHKRVDLESADGLFSDKGYPLGTSRDAVAGGDNLDYWSHDGGLPEELYRRTST